MANSKKRTFLIPRDVAEQLGENVSKVLVWIRSGELVAANVSNSANRPRWRIKPEALEAFLAARSSSEHTTPSVVRSPREINTFNPTWPDQVTCVTEPSPSQAEPYLASQRRRPIDVLQGSESS